MTRKEEKTETGKSVTYIVGGDINVCAIIAELSEMGAADEDISEACKTLSSKNRTYRYENRQTRDSLTVIDENAACNSPFSAMFCALLMLSPFGKAMPASNPMKSLIEELKNGGEEVR